MLVRRYRLTKRNDFKKVFQRGKKSFGKLFSIRHLVNDLENPRIAVVVSNKVSKRAIVRNKIKRRIRAVVKNNLADVSDNYDVIISALPPSVDVDYDTLKVELINALKQNNILK
jgi:ribonuclease P protein component